MLAQILIRENRTWVAASPLRPAEGSVIIDSTDLSETQVVDKILGIIKQMNVFAGRADENRKVGKFYRFIRPIGGLLCVFPTTIDLHLRSTAGGCFYWLCKSYFNVGSLCNSKLCFCLKLLFSFRN